jgi:hypothetical protein
MERDGWIYEKGQFCPLTERHCMQEYCALWVDTDENDGSENGCAFFAGVLENRKMLKRKKNGF